MRQFDSISDFVLDETFCSFLLDENSPYQEIWESFIRSNPQYHAMIEEAKQEVLRIHRSVLDMERTRGLSRLKEEVEHVERALSHDKSTPVFQWRWIAAAAIIICLIGLGWYFKYPTFGPSFLDSYVTQYSERKTIELPDGTKIILNASSELHVDESFGQINRTVYLDGEAFFDVAHDVKKPFIVNLNGVDIKVLGTTFNVKSYKNDPFITTSLLSGSIEVGFKDKKRDNIVLQPSDKLIVDNPNYQEIKSVVAVKPLDQTMEKSVKTVQIEKIKLNPADNIIAETSWTAEKLVFADMPLADIAKILERWYNVEIEISNKELGNRGYNAGFNDDEQLEKILKALSGSIPFHYEILPDNKIIINP